MVAEFAEGGIRFKYPENWRLQRQADASGWTASLQSPRTAYFLLSLNKARPSATELAETALEAMRDDYPDLEASAEVDVIAGRRAVGHDINFFCLDLTNTCWTRSFSTPQGTVLVMWSITDLELDALGPVLHAICASVQVEDE
jgi:hypothetical protein